MGPPALRGSEVFQSHLRLGTKALGQNSRRSGLGGGIYMNLPHYWMNQRIRGQTGWKVRGRKIRKCSRRRPNAKLHVGPNSRRSMSGWERLPRDFLALKCGQVQSCCIVLISKAGQRKEIICVTSHGKYLASASCLVGAHKMDRTLLDKSCHPNTVHLRVPHRTLSMTVHSKQPRG